MNFGSAPRVTLEHIKSIIASEKYHVFQSTTLTICVLTLRNGFTITGESACASTANFDEALGRSLARDNAVDKIWALEGYALKERMYAASRGDDNTLHAVQDQARLELLRAIHESLGIEIGSDVLAKIAGLKGRRGTDVSKPSRQEQLAKP